VVAARGRAFATLKTAWGNPVQVRILRSPLELRDWPRRTGNRIGNKSACRVLTAIAAKTPLAGKSRRPIVQRGQQSAPSEDAHRYRVATRDGTGEGVGRVGATIVLD
jgi:hypothetical protein